MALSSHLDTGVKGNKRIEKDRKRKKRGSWSLDSLIHGQGGFTLALAVAEWHFTACSFCPPNKSFPIPKGFQCKAIAMQVNIIRSKIVPKSRAISPFFTLYLDFILLSTWTAANFIVRRISSFLLFSGLYSYRLYFVFTIQYQFELFSDPFFIFI